MKEKEMGKQSTITNKKGATSDDFSKELIKDLNKEAGSIIAFNLGVDDAPTNIKRWIGTGSRQLDIILSNKLEGGLPEGRIVEIFGLTSSGKSHLCIEIAKSTQKMGGIVVYIDTENATNLDNLVALGLNVDKQFVFVQTNCTEEVFSTVESVIIKARSMTKDVPVVVFWDSVAASSPKAELEGDYNQNTIGLQARVMGKGLRKIVNMIGNLNVLFVVVNQVRKNINVFFGDDTTTPGGLALPYCASTRIRIMSTGQSQIKDKNGQIIGIKVKAKTIKNKIARPFRECEFQIHFGKGIVEHEEVFDLFKNFCKNSKNKGLKLSNGEKIEIGGEKSWKNFTIYSKNGKTLNEIKFHKAEFKEKVLDVPAYKKYIEALFEAALVMKINNTEHATLTGIDSNSFIEVQAASLETNKK